MKCLYLFLYGLVLAGFAGCVEVPVYPADPVLQIPGSVAPTTRASQDINTTLPVAPMAPMAPPLDGKVLLEPAPLNGLPSSPRYPAINPALRPNLSTDSPDYWTDPRLPTNRGQWQTIRGPSGQPMRVYSTDIDRYAPDAVHRSGLPAGNGGFQPADTRWDQQLRR